MAQKDNKPRERATVKHGSAVNKEQPPPPEVMREIDAVSDAYQARTSQLAAGFDELTATEDEIAEQAEIYQRVVDRLGITAEARALHALNKRRATRIKNAVKRGAATDKTEPPRRARRS